MCQLGQLYSFCRGYTILDTKQAFFGLILATKKIGYLRVLETSRHFCFRKIRQKYVCTGIYIDWPPKSLDSSLWSHMKDNGQIYIFHKKSNLTLCLVWGLYYIRLEKDLVKVNGVQFLVKRLIFFKKDCQFCLGVERKFLLNNIWLKYSDVETWIWQ